MKRTVVTESIQLAGIRLGSVIAIAVTTMRTLSAATLYVSPGNLGQAPPFSNWLTAASDIQQAVDAAATGDEIVVTNGIYTNGGRSVDGTMTNRVTVSKSLRLRSVNGPAVTIIQGTQAAGGGNGEGAVRCIYLTEGASLTGFTLTQGATRDHGDLDRGMSGGGAWCASTNTLITNCVFAGNQAQYFGAGARGGTLYNCSLIDNSARHDGGGAYFSVLHQCALVGNSAAQWGGGAFGGRLYSCALTGNSAAGSGGGVVNAVLFNCTLTGNAAAIYGGGADASTLSNCIVSGNTAQYSGGADWSTIYNCTLSRNVATSGAGGTAYSMAFNCVLDRNRTSFLGGGAVGCGLYNCTLAGNVASSFAGGVYGGALANCIVYFNRATNGPNFLDAALDYCCTTPSPTNGFGNLEADPSFMDAAGGDFRLRPDSPCIDAATNLIESLAIDRLGLPRALDGNGDGITRLDMGAYEFNPYRFELPMQIGADGLVLVIRGEPGKTAQLDRSRDLRTWEPVATVLIPCSGATTVNVPDPAAIGSSLRFYRAAREP